MPRFTAKSRGIGARGGVGKRGRTAGYKFFADPRENPADPVMVAKAKAMWGDQLSSLLEARRKGRTKGKQVKEPDDE